MLSQTVFLSFHICITITFNLCGFRGVRKDGTMRKKKGIKNNTKKSKPNNRLYFWFSLFRFRLKNHFLFRIVTVIISHMIKNKRWNTCVILCGYVFLAIFLLLFACFYFFRFFFNIWYEWTSIVHIEQQNLHTLLLKHTHIHTSKQYYMTERQKKHIKNKDQKKKTRDNPNWMCNEIKIYTSRITYQ